MKIEQRTVGCNGLNGSVEGWDEVERGLRKTRPGKMFQEAAGESVRAQGEVFGGWCVGDVPWGG